MQYDVPPATDQACILDAEVDTLRLTTEVSTQSVASSSWLLVALASAHVPPVVPVELIVQAVGFPSCNDDRQAKYTLAPVPLVSAFVAGVAELTVATDTSPPVKAVIPVTS